MKKLFTAIILIFVLSACTNKLSNAPLSSDEALTKIENGAVVLDARLPYDFNNGHIKGAISLGDNLDIMNILVPDKNTVLLICDGDDVLIENLKAQGYSSVYSIGSIRDWKYEIIWDATDTIFYNYYGGDLPKDVTTEIAHTITHGTTTFTLNGARAQKYSIIGNRERYYLEDGETRITSIDVNGEGFSQQLTGFATQTPAIADYGFSIDDWNFDGYPDVSIWLFPGGSMGNLPTKYWLWNEEIKQFVENEQLGDLSWSSGVSVNAAEQCITSYVRVDAAEHWFTTWAFENGQYIETRSIGKFYDPENDIQRVQVHERVDGEMALVDEYYEAKD